ncbi:hypothetical protein GGI07_003561 [Coemansia sp. Benny D115]|nr:hypothetical protein GGI07_003561 [Coemansia sp. Benny D115]
MIMRSRVAAAAPVATQSAPPMAAALRPDPAAHTPKPAPAHTPAPVPADPYAPSLFGEPIPFYLYPNSSVPVFCPTMEQFNDFEALVAAIEPLALRAGVCKIIPPRKWRQQLEQQNKTGDGPAHVFSDDAFPILKPIVQHFNGSSGIFHQYNVEFHRRLKLAQFFQTSQDASHRVPEQHTKKDEGAPSVAASEQSDDDDVCESEDVGIAVDYGRGEVRLTSAAAMALQQGLRSDALRARFQPAVARYRPQPDTDGEAACGPDGLATKQYTSDDGRALFVTAREHAANEELERVYWKNLLFQPPMYGADVLGTLFPEPEAFPTWNIRYLPGLLRRIGQRMPGVNDPYLYLGMWKATFAWHVEDMDLYSINYIHFGAPKAWYAIPVDARHRFEMSMQNVFAQDYKTCSQFLRHKAFLLSPRFLASQGIPYNRVVQRAGEIILTFPLGYHAGFNHGFNCAESVNFALDRWLDIARESKHCECVKDSVTIDLMEWFGDCSRADVHKDTCAVDSSATPSEHQTNKSKRVSPRRHAAAAAAMSPPPAASQTEPQHKRPPGRPRKTECTHPATASHSNTATSTTPATPTKRKSPSSPPDTQNSTNGGGGEPSPKRLAKPKRLAAQTQCRQRPSVRTAANKVPAMWAHFTFPMFSIGF